MIEEQASLDSLMPYGPMAWLTAYRPHPNGLLVILLILTLNPLLPQCPLHLSPLCFPYLPL
jgi:hypothetical protein